MNLVSTLPRVGAAFQWRQELVTAKLAGKRPLIPWGTIWSEVSQHREFVFPTPEFRVLEQDEAAQLMLLEAGDAQYWLPSEMDPAAFPCLYKEVFNPQHPHHYEYRGSRLRPGDVAIDCGACEGFFTRFALDRGANVIVVEPWSRMAAGLARTFAKEIAQGRVKIEQVFLSDKSGSAELQLNPREPFAAAAWQPDDPNTIKEVMPSVTLTELARRSPWGRCDFLKMDVEGSECTAIAGAREMLQEDRPRISLATYHRATDFGDISTALRGYCSKYRVAGKGLWIGDDRKWRPLFLHAWAED